MFKHYQIVVFKDRTGSCGHIRISGWLVFFFLFLILGLTGAVVYLWSFYPRTIAMSYQLQEAEKTIQSQNTQIMSIGAKLQSLQEDMRRVQQFDAKLRMMMNVDREPAETSGGAENAENTGAQNYVPLHRQDLLAKRMHSLADLIAQDLSMEELRQQEIILGLRENREFMVTTPSIWPAEGHLSSGFGYRVSPFTGQATLHAGLDIANRIGTPIVSPAKGTVTFVGWQGAYGNCVTINHGNAISTRYAHMEKTSVKEGQTVNRGDLIGTVGNTGRTTGPHLHYEVRIGGVPVNPMRYILN
jgi:murein DD-endopeptidase MepM/ murein hydrolase activator NlpD